MQGIARHESVEESIRVFLVDDHPLLRIGLRHSLNSNRGITVVSEADNGFKAVQGIMESCPDVVLMDVDMPGLSGIEATRLLRTEFPGMIILVLSNYRDEKYIVGAMDAGADGYISKTIDVEELVGMIRCFHHNEAAVSPYLINLSTGRCTSRHSAGGGASNSANPQELTGRERQVLRCIAEGKTNKDISNQLFISVETVKSHTKSIFRKLEAKTRIEAARKASQMGILT